MSDERWARLKALFNGALDQPADARAAWLARMETDAAVRREVELLLHAHDTAGDFLERPAVLEGPAEAGRYDRDLAREAPRDVAPHVVSGFSRTRIGPYAIERELGRGGMGVVYLANDTRLHRRVALKLIPDAQAANAMLRERLRREARAAAAITHPGVATVYALEESGDDLFIVSEYVEGRTLRELLHDTAIDMRRAVAITADVVRALAAAHDAGVVHRDLKPENIILLPSGTVKLVDFGIAQAAERDEARLTRQGTAPGTPAYMAPEQLAGLGGDMRSDVFAAGILLGELVTGVHPLAPGAPPMPAAVAPLVERATAPDPNARYQSAREFLAGIDSFNTPRAAGAGGPARTWWALHQALAVLVYVAMMIPMWSARQLIGGVSGRALFVASLAAAIVSSLLRLHAWFASRWHESELRRVRQASTPIIRAADTVLTMSMVVAGLFVGDANEGLALLLFSVGLGIAVSSLAIEPSTTRAAFKR